jgi:hypothetical protein
LLLALISVKGGITITTTISLDPPGVLLVEIDLMLRAGLSWVGLVGISGHRRRSSNATVLKSPKSTAAG